VFAGRAMAFAVRISAIGSGVGNIQSVLRALDRTVPGAKEIGVTSEPDVVRSADVLVVPGQGSFGAFAASIDSPRGLREALVEHIRAGKPYFGICLGLQILFDESDEAPSVRGLGILRGRVRRLEPGLEAGKPRPLPHIGWNLAQPSPGRDGDRNDPLVAADHYYFAHSYAAAPADPGVSVATTEYGETFTSAVHENNVFGVQFHPEKSQQAGLSLLERFFSSLRSGT
jgi:imidazole glycerol-phosphate synthase subunit HisH